MRVAWIAVVFLLAGCQGFLTQDYEREAYVFYVRSPECIVEVRQGVVEHGTGVLASDDNVNQLDLHGGLQSVDDEEEDNAD